VRSGLERLLLRIWSGHRTAPLGVAGRLLYLLLIPFGMVWSGLVWARREGYRLGLARRRRVTGLTVVSIGNLTVGGTGKTPLVVDLARALLERDVRTAVVSRGYGVVGRGVGPLLVSDGAGPLVGAEAAGDEAVMIARAVPAVVLVSRDRRIGARLARERYGAEVVILDDGFQHLRVARDADIVLLDARDPFGNGWTLPAGRLREPLSALGDADLFIFVHRGVTGVRPIPHRLRGLLRALRPGAVTLDGVLRMSRLRRGGGNESRAIGQLVDRGVVLVSGLADPEPFEAEVRQRGARVLAHLAFGDHHRYGPAELARVRGELARSGAEWVLTTAKDEVKLVPAGLGCSEELWVAEYAFDPRTVELLVKALIRRDIQDQS
jgi:tetraacyldisaccharide 4'-kinase